MYMIKNFHNLKEYSCHIALRISQKVTFRPSSGYFRIDTNTILTDCMTLTATVYQVEKRFNSLGEAELTSKVTSR